MNPLTNFLFDVFLSHSSLDKSIVREVSERLKNRGVSPWLDEDQIKAGESIPERLAEGLDQSRSLILFLSNNLETSDWATLERNVHIFDDPMARRRKIIPVLLTDSKIPALLRHRRYIDARSGISLSIIEDLIRSLK